jgi:hypothetical protein
MAIQMQAVRGSSPGFNRVVSLLGQLVDDSKRQLHHITKIWRGVNARCHVSKVKLQGRQEYFETYLGQANRNVKHAVTRLAEVNDHIAGFKKSLSSYSDLLKFELGFHKQSRERLQRRYTNAQNALKSLAAARNAVKDWSPKGRALIQTHIEEVSKSYAKIKNFSLPDITDFLERTTDAKVRGRLLEWMDVLNDHMLVSSAQFKNALNRLNNIGTALEQGLGSMVFGLQKSLVFLNEAVHFNQGMKKASEKSIAFYSKLAAENSKLASSNKAYCLNERTSFTKNQANAKSAIKLFKHLKGYFVDNYDKIHSYIKAKYNW